MPENESFLPYMPTPGDIACPVCGTVTTPQSQVCAVCGAALDASQGRRVDDTDDASKGRGAGDASPPRPR
jgi:hypothetical protein